MRLLYFIVFITISAVNSYSQVVGGINAKGMDIQTWSNGFVKQLPMAPPETEGSVYLSDEWREGEVLLRDSTQLKNLVIRYNLNSRSLEVRYGDQVRLISDAKIYNFAWKDRISLQDEFYISLRDFQWKFEEEKPSGFCKVVRNGNWQVLLGQKVKLIKSSYNPVLDAGSKNNKYIKKEEIYLGNNNVIYKTHVSTRKFLSQFDTEHRELVEKIIQDHGINLKDSSDIVKLSSLLEQVLSNS